MPQRLDVIFAVAPAIGHIQVKTDNSRRDHLSLLTAISYTLPSGIPTSLDFAIGCRSTLLVKWLSI